MANSKKTLQVKKPGTGYLDHRDVDYMKPDGYKDFMTLTEVSVEVGRDPSWLRKLEADQRIPKAHRVKVGELNVRLWSPNQVKEIKLVLSTLKRGRPTSG